MRFGLKAILGLVLLSGGGDAARGADVPALPVGRWRVVENGWGLDSPLRAIEVRRADPTADTIVIAFERDEGGHERVWGSARLERRTSPASPGRWVTAEWTAGPSAVAMRLGPERDGKLCAVMRLRDRQRSPAVPDRVRQAILEPEPAAQVNPAAAVSRPRLVPPEPPEGPRPDLMGLFTVDREGGSLRLVVGPDGSGFTRAAYPAWSPDGRWIAFTAFDASGREPLIEIVAASGGRPTAVASGIAPSWSRDGKTIAYVASGKPSFATDWTSPGRNDERIEAIRLSGPGAGEVDVLAQGLWPRWSPSDDRLAFSARRDANWDLYVRSADGLRLSRLTDDPALDTRPVWTSDGRSLMFLSDRGNRWDLYRVPADRREQVSRLTNQRRREEGADLSPDGELVAFTETTGRNASRILVLELASGLVRPLLDSPDADRDPAWSPDGRSIAFVSRRPGPPSRAGVGGP